MAQRRLIRAFALCRCFGVSLGSICTTVLRYALRHDHKTAVVAAVLTGRQRNELTGANGYDIILETNDKGEIFIDGLRIGDYTISEVSNSASSMYVLPADKKATVKLGSTTIVEMHNVLRDTPKTGDTTNLPLLYALAGLSAVGIAVCGVIGFKKKKKEDRN